MDGAGTTPFRRLTFHGLLAGLCPLIPLPFLDDWTFDWVRRRQAASIFRAHGRLPELTEIRALTDDPGRGVARGCLRFTLIVPLLKLVRYVLRKIFRKLIFIFLLSDCANHFSKAFHEGYLLDLALRRGLLGDGSPPADRLERLRKAVRAACRAVDPRPVRQIVRRSFRGSRRLIQEGARLLTDVARRRRRQGADDVVEDNLEEAATLADEERLLSGLLDRLMAALREETGHWAELEAAFASAAREQGLSDSRSV